MKGMIKLSVDYSDVPIWVNPFFIASITKARCGSAVFIAMDANPCFVKETPEEILSLIKSIVDP